MYKLAVWLWSKAERSTAQNIIDLMSRYWVTPQHPGDKATEAEAKRYYTELKSWKDSRTVIEMIQNRYFPERRQDAKTPPKN